MKTKPIDQFYKNRKGDQFWYKNHCKTCAYDKRKARGPEYDQNTRLWTRYRLRLDAYNLLIAFQKGLCPICKRDLEGLITVVDHDHSCCPGRRSCGACVRGIICKGCNYAMGHFNDDVEAMQRAIEYLNGERGRINVTV